MATKVIRAVRFPSMFVAVGVAASGCAKAPQDVSNIAPPPPSIATAPAAYSSAPIGNAAYETLVKPYSDAYFRCTSQRTKKLAFEPESPANIAIAATMGCMDEWLKLKTQLTMALGQAKATLAADEAQRLAREGVVTIVVEARAKIREYLANEAAKSPKPTPKKGADI